MMSLNQTKVVNNLGSCDGQLVRSSIEYNQRESLSHMYRDKKPEYLPPKDQNKWDSLHQPQETFTWRSHHLHHCYLLCQLSHHLQHAFGKRYAQLRMLGRRLPYNAVPFWWIIPWFCYSEKPFGRAKTNFLQYQCISKTKKMCLHKSCLRRKSGQVHVGMLAICTV